MMKGLVYLATLVCILSACSGTQPSPSETKTSQSATAIPMATRTPPPPSADPGTATTPALKPSTMPEVQEPPSGEPLVAFQCHENIEGARWYHLVVGEWGSSEFQSVMSNQDPFEHLAWSPDGSRMLVLWDGKLSILGPDNWSQVTKVEDSHTLDSAEWSSDGNTVLLGGSFDFEGKGVVGGVAVANPAGEVVEFYAQDDYAIGSFAAASLSPDQKRAAFQSEVLVDGLTQSRSLNLLDLKTGAISELGDVGGGLSSGPIWLPDSQRILYAYSAPDSRIVVQGVDGVILNAVAGKDPVLSPDGSKFIFRRGCGSSLSGAWMAPTDSRGALRIRNEGLDASWTSDGKNLVYADAGYLGEFSVGQTGDETHETGFCDDIVGAPLMQPAHPPRPVVYPSGPAAMEAGTEGIPSGSLVAFVCANEDAETSLVVTSVDGSEHLQLFTARGLKRPSWSPDGTAILAEGQGRTIYVTGFQNAPASTVSWYGHQAQWSPDGAHVVFRALGDYTHEVIAVASRAGEIVEAHAIRRGLSSGLSYPATSPDGKKIAFTWHECREDSTDNAGRWSDSLKVLDIDTGRARQLTIPGPGIWSDSPPIWLPDSQRIVWTYKDTSSQQSHQPHLQVVTLENLTTLDVLGDYPKLTTDGTKLTYVGQLGENYYGTVVAEVDGSGADVIAGGWPLVDATWTPDGKGILYTEQGGIGIKGVYGGSDMFIEVGYCDGVGQPVMQP